MLFEKIMIQAWWIKTFHIKNFRKKSIKETSCCQFCVITKFSWILTSFQTTKPSILIFAVVSKYLTTTCGNWKRQLKRKGLNGQIAKESCFSTTVQGLTNSKQHIRNYWSLLGKWCRVPHIAPVFNNQFNFNCHLCRSLENFLNGKKSVMTSKRTYLNF